MRVHKHYRPRKAWFPLVILGVIGLGALVGLCWSLLVGFGVKGPPFPVFLLPLAIAAVNLAA